MDSSVVALNALKNGLLRFSEIAEHGGPGDKVLSSRLKDLEALGLIRRTLEPGPPVRVICELRAKGHAFGQVAEAIER